MKPAKIAKLQINMTDKALRELENLQISTGASTKTEVVKTSLRLYNFLEKEKEDGAKILVREKNGKEREVVF